MKKSEREEGVDANERRMTMRGRAAHKSLSFSSSLSPSLFVERRIYRRDDEPACMPTKLTGWLVDWLAGSLSRD